MKPEIRRFHSPDISDLETYVPEDPECFCFLLQVVIGPEGEEGEESFDVEVCTPLWLANNYDKETVIVGRHYLIVFEYNFDRIANTIREFCNKCTGENWKEVALKLSRLGKWEFEDYKP